MPQADGPVKFTDVDRDPYSGIGTESNRVVRDANAWSALWAQHKSGRTPQPALPAIDFSKDLIAAVFAGQRPNSCWELNIERVSRLEGKIVVEYRLRDVTPVAICAMAITSPSHLVALPRTDLPVEFRRLTN